MYLNCISIEELLEIDAAISCSTNLYKQLSSLTQWWGKQREFLRHPLDSNVYTEILIIFMSKHMNDSFYVERLNINGL